MKPSVRSFLTPDDWNTAAPYLRLVREKKDDVAFLAGMVRDMAETLRSSGWADWMAVPIIAITTSREVSDAILIKHTDDFAELLASMYPWLERTSVTVSSPMGDEDDELIPDTRMVH